MPLGAAQTQCGGALERLRGPPKRCSLRRLGHVRRHHPADRRFASRRGPPCPRVRRCLRRFGCRRRRAHRRCGQPHVAGRPCGPKIRAAPAARGNAFPLRKRHRQVGARRAHPRGKARGVERCARGGRRLRGGARSRPALRAAARAFERRRRSLAAAVGTDGLVRGRDARAPCRRRRHPARGSRDLGGPFGAFRRRLRRSPVARRGPGRLRQLAGGRHCARTRARPHTRRTRRFRAPCSGRLPTTTCTACT